jgi:hypothetical protein
MHANGTAPKVQRETWSEMGVVVSGDSPFAYLMNMLLYLASLLAGVFARR